MSDRDNGLIVIILMVIVAVFWSVITWDNTRKSWQTKAVKHQAASWVVTTDGKTEFQWNTSENTKVKEIYLLVPQEAE